MKRYNKSQFIYIVSLLAAALVILLTACGDSLAGNSYKISGWVRGLTGEHKAYISIYAGESNFKSGLALKSTIIFPESVKNSKSQYSFLMPEGEYLIHVFEDLNDDKKLNHGGFFNSPREPYGYYKRFRPLFYMPSFEKLKFNLNKEIKNANINLIKS